MDQGKPDFDRVIVLVIDGLGVGAMPDVPTVRPRDVGADTLGHVVRAAGGLSLPNLERMGLGTIAPTSGLRIEANPIVSASGCSSGSMWMTSGSFRARVGASHLGHFVNRSRTYGFRTNE